MAKGFKTTLADVEPLIFKEKTPLNMPKSIEGDNLETIAQLLTSMGFDRVAPRQFQKDGAMIIAGADGVMFVLANQEVSVQLFSPVHCIAIVKS